VSSKKSSDVKAVIMVVAVAFVCAGALAFVERSTSEARTKAKAMAAVGAYSKVLGKGCEVIQDPGYLNEPVTWTGGPVQVKVLELYPGFDSDGGLCGLVVKAQTNSGYSGKIVLLAGFSHLESAEALVLNRIYVLEQSETPGLGSKSTDLQDEPVENWRNLDRKKVFGVNFVDKPASKVADPSLFLEKKAAEAGEWDVAAITASTITSKAVTVVVKDTVATVSGNLDEIKRGIAAKVGKR